ncbi:chorismate synthase [Flavipsychrobacter stenotrophus]|uniref:Chorismate synthase n=1 Tax=Flavipsychrobacter stenotrophus TaxID=2077091 RepID=A0A2S7T1X0_9BACT|nr:chorismate synthase [Flavipsychrobacter stenotrophus]PQJ12928.1 chorismate synthase [Flavipsychrobacter stenotrophus]
MNTFGTLFRISIFGESHGKWVGVTIDGCPAGIALSETDLLPDLERRKAGAVGTTPRKEDDLPTFASGVFNGHTTGAPLTIIFENNNTRSADYEALRATPRPGHADFVLDKKFSGYNDYRGGGHSSGRLTVALVAAGVVAMKVISNITVQARLVEAGGNANIEAAITKAVEEQDSIGGIVECRAGGIPVGLGEPFFNSIESVISHAVFAIPAIKGIEFGSGFAAAKMTGSAHNDAIVDELGTTLSNNAGGINGGITNGNELVFRVAVKPTSSTPKEQQTWNNNTGAVEPFTVKGRHDLCIALRVPVVVEAVTAIVLADMTLQAKG